jgi:predicted ribosome quality control (RQC) complex YloA/Tae2 family protein
VDAVTLDGIVGELRPALVGRYLGRVRLAGPHAVSFELPGERRLWLDAGRGVAGFYVLGRDAARALTELAGGESTASGRTRQALLLLRKHVGGARVTDLRRVAGERFVVLEAGEARLCLRLSGSAPASTLGFEEAPLCTFGEGPEAWPAPVPAPERDWDRVEPHVIARAVAEDGGAARVRAILSVAPAFGPALARELDGSEEGLRLLRARLNEARPTLVAPSAVEDWTDEALASEKAVQLLPFAPAGAEGVILHPRTWTSAAASFLTARLRGQRFAERRRRLADEARRQLRRLLQLEVHLEADLREMPEAEALRRTAEALLAAPPGAAMGGETVEVGDPYAPGSVLKVRLDARLSLPQNADRIFDKARRIERARRKVESRLGETRAAIVAARRAEEEVGRAHQLSDFPPPGGGASPSPGSRKDGGPRRYLTSRGLAMLVGRGGKENHRVTFGLARPEDVWLHARDVPGAHVVLRDDEGRATAEDLREAAEVAAFFSEKRGERQVDVHVARRKHVRPARGGGPGRVSIGHSETLRVAPRDPEGRLRRR